MSRLSLNGSWDGSCISPDNSTRFSFLGTVPGCVHTDLMGSHIPTDIYYRDHVDSCQWIEQCDWKYTRSFLLETLPAKANLVFEGLDTYADIVLNGTPVGAADNMFLSHRFDVTELLTLGENTVTVSFRSPVREVQNEEDRPGAFTHERMHTRRMQCTYGWDWVARLVTCGIWRDVYLDCMEDFRVKNIYVYTESIWQDLAQIVVEADLEGYASGRTLSLELKDPEGNLVYRHCYFCKEPTFRKHVTVPNAQLWYPCAYGAQPLYTLEINGNKQVFGIRTVMIEERPDEPGSPYYNKCLEIKDSDSGRTYDKNDEFSGFRLG